jgi:hypothetical protein
MADIVERLINIGPHCPLELRKSAADEIERLRGLLRRVSQGGYPWGMAQLLEEIDATLKATTDQPQAIRQDCTCVGHCGRDGQPFPDTCNWRCKGLPTDKSGECHE